MTVALLIIFAACLLSPLGDLAARHWLAWRRARNAVWPPMRVIEVQDEIPF